MNNLSLDLEKFILMSSIGISCLLTGSFMASSGCDSQTPLWNQQLQSTKSFGSLAIEQPVTTSQFSIPKPFTKKQCP
jgi:hypothetical protein